MLNEKVLNAIQSLDYSNRPFSEITDKLYWEDVMAIMEMNEYEQEEEIVDALPQHIRLVYLLIWMQTTIMNDSFLSVFYNHSLFEIKRFIEVMKADGFSDLSELIKKALQIILSKFPLPHEESHTFMQDTDAQPDDFFGDDICEQIEAIEEEIEDLYNDDDFWERVEVVWNSLQSK